MDSFKLTLLDCTLRDGGYYNSWDFSNDLIQEYLQAMKAAQLDVVELGFRFLRNVGFKGACAYTTEDFLDSLTMPTLFYCSSMCIRMNLVGRNDHFDSKG